MFARFFRLLAFCWWRNAAFLAQSRSSKPVMQVKPAWTLLALALLCGVGAGLRGWNLVERPIWEDESYTWTAAQGPWFPLLLGRNDKHHGPLSPLLVRLAMESTGSSEPWVLRLPALICGVLCIPAGYWLGRSLVGRPVGLAIAGLIAVDLNMVDQSHQARMYSMLMLVTLLALRRGAWLLGEAPAPPGRRPWIVLGALLGLLLLINFGGLAVWLGVAAAGAWRTTRDWRHHGWDGGARDRARGLAVAYCTAVVVGSRGVWLLWKMSGETTQRGPMSVPAALASLLSAATNLDGLGWAAVAAAVLAAAGIGLLARRDAALAWAVAGAAAATLALVFVGRFKHGVFAPRYLTLTQPAMWLGLAYLPLGMTSTAGRRVALAGLLLVGGLECGEAVKFLQPGHDPEWEFLRTAATWIHAHREPGDGVLVCPNLNYRCLARYYGIYAPADESLASCLAETEEEPPVLRPRRMWVIVHLDTTAARHDLPRLLAWYGRPLAADEHASVLRCCGGDRLGLLCLEPDRFGCWGFDCRQRCFRECPPLVAGHAANASGRR